MTTALSPADGDAVVRIRDLHKTFRRADGSAVPAINGVDVDVHPGEFVVLLGPSGCGKTTLLNAVAGLERPDSGLIEVNGTPVFSDAARIDVRPERRPISMVFQSYALWPHMNVGANVAFPLQCTPGRRLSKKELRDRVQSVLETVGIGDLSRQFPSQLSGGQQQRVALARALIAGSAVVLFDEPLSNVDAKVREQLRLELLSMQRSLNFSALFVTHDQQEAMALAHRILVMERGKVAQSGTPVEIYEHPVSRYVARFIGSSNEVHGRIVADRTSSGTVVDTPIGAVRSTMLQAARSAGDAVIALWRPERAFVAAEQQSGVNCWNVVVETSLFLGSHSEHLVRLGGHTFRTSAPGRTTLEPGSRMWLCVPYDAVHVLPAEGAGHTANGSVPEFSPAPPTDHAVPPAGAAVDR